MSVDREAIEKMVNAFEDVKYQTPSALLMGALLSTDLPQSELNQRIGSVLDDMDLFSSDRPLPFSSVFLTNVFIWSLPDNLKGAFFSKLELSRSGLLMAAVEAIDEWDKSLQEKEVKKEDLLQYYKDLATLLDKACEGIDNKETINDFFEIPRRIIDYLS